MTVGNATVSTTGTLANNNSSSSAGSTVTSTDSGSLPPAAHSLARTSSISAHLSAHDRALLLASPHLDDDGAASQGAQSGSKGHLRAAARAFRRASRARGGHSPLPRLRSYAFPPAVPPVTQRQH